MKKNYVRVLAMTFAFIFLLTLPALVAFGEESDSDGGTWIKGFMDPSPDGGRWLNGIPLWADLSRINWEKTTFDHWEYLTPELGDSSIPDELLYVLAAGALARVILIHVRRKSAA